MENEWSWTEWIRNMEHEEREREITLIKDEKPDTLTKRC